VNTQAIKRRGSVSPALAQQRTNPLDSDKDGVKVAFDGAQYQVAFEFNATAAQKMRAVPGAEFDSAAKVWGVPLDSYQQLAQVVLEIRTELDKDRSARAELEEVAFGEALVRMGERGTDSEISPHLSGFKDQGKAYIGEIIAANGRYAAQLTGYGTRDGAAFVVVHRLDDLSEAVFKGDKIAITYGPKGRGEVSNRQSLEEKLDESLGRYVDGVKVTLSNGKYQVAFDYNPALINRIHRIDGAERDADAKVWTVAADKKEYLARAVNDMRKEVVADRADRRELEALAAQKIDGGQVRDAYAKDGQAYTGKILGTNGRYALQHTGKEYTALHRVDALDTQVGKDQTVRIAYDKGKGKVYDKSQHQGKSLDR
jgi:hypothetical protein